MTRIKNMIDESKWLVREDRKARRACWIAGILAFFLALTPVLAPIHEVGHALFARGTGTMTWRHLYYTGQQPWVFYIGGFLVEHIVVVLAAFIAATRYTRKPRARHPAWSLSMTLYAWGVCVFFLFSRDLEQSVTAGIPKGTTAAVWLVYMASVMIPLHWRVAKYFRWWRKGRQSPSSVSHKSVG